MVGLHTSDQCAETDFENVAVVFACESLGTECQSSNRAHFYARHELSRTLNHASCRLEETSYHDMLYLLIMSAFQSAGKYLDEPAYACGGGCSNGHHLRVTREKRGGKKKKNRGDSQKERTSQHVSDH